MLKQKELFTTSWGVNSGFKTLVDELNNLLPMSGRCEKPLSTNKNLEYFINKWNIPTQSSFRYFTKDSWEMWEDQIEKIFTPIVIKAAKEQGLV